ncbi:hypothetical protein GCM10009845_38400 [Pedococcus bigeumensis]
MPENVYDSWVTRAALAGKANAVNRPATAATPSPRNILTCLMTSAFALTATGGVPGALHLTVHANEGGAG